MKKKRYVLLGLVLVGVVALALSGWMYSGSARAVPGTTCHPDFEGHKGGHCVPATTTTEKPTTTTAKPGTTTTQGGPGTTGGPTTTAGGTTTTGAGTTTTAGGPTTTGGTTTTTAGGTSTTGATTSTTVAPGPPGVTSFSDVSSTSPYHAEITDMARRQVINGFADGTFKQQLSVTRKDFARMIVKALGLAVTGNESSPFTDIAAVQDTDPMYPAKYIAACFNEGITVGKTSTTYAPDDKLSRQQLITMVVRAAKKAKAAEDFMPPFTPGQFYPDEHYANARLAASMGLINGLQGMGPGYDFFAPANRGEVCFVLYNLLNKD